MRFVLALVFLTGVVAACTTGDRPRPLTTFSGAPDAGEGAPLPAVPDGGAPGAGPRVDARAPGTEASAPDAPPPVAGWTFLGALERWPGTDRTDLVVAEGAIVAPMYGRGWDLASAAYTDPMFVGDVNVTFRREGCACLIGTRAFVMGGGGNGVTGSWDEWTYLEADFTKRTVTAHPAPYVAHAVACAVVGGRCLVIGGDTAPGRALGSAAVRTFDPTLAAFERGTPLPWPTAAAAVAVGDGRVVVAGGYCGGGDPCPPSNDASGSGATVLASVASLAPEGGAWQEEPALPRPIARATMVYVAGRFHVLGGSGSVSGGDDGARWSWAPGEKGWRDEGSAPGTGPVVAAFSEGEQLFVVVAEASFEFGLYRKD